MSGSDDSPFAVIYSRGADVVTKYVTGLGKVLKAMSSRLQRKQPLSLSDIDTNAEIEKK